MELLEPNDIILEKKVLLFDFDGTIANTSKFHESAFNQVLEPYGLKVNYPEIAGMSTYDAIKKCIFSENKYQYDESWLYEHVIRKQENVRRMISRSLEANPKISRYIEWASLRYTLALVTSGSKDTVELALDKLGLSGYFSVKIFSNDVLRTKPSPEGFLLALEKTGFSPSSALVYEDSSSGFKAAINANIDYIDVNKFSWEILR